MSHFEFALFNVVNLVKMSLQTKVMCVLYTLPLVPKKLIVT
jgi:hypothetical protein